jgi:hypothetical protein
MLLEQGLDLGGQRADLPLDGGQGLLRGAGRPRQLEQDRDRRDHESEERQAGDQRGGV